MAFGTAGEVIADAANEVGLGSFDPASFDPWGSSDPNILQMIALLKSAGRALVRERNWTYLVREHTFTTVAGQAAYDYPAGFLNMIDQTGWVRSTRLPLGGPLSPQEWQYLKARLVGVTLTLLFRPMQQKMWIFPDTNTPGDLTVAFEYQSGLWAAKSPNVVPSVSAIWEAATDYNVGDQIGQAYYDGCGVWTVTAAGTSSTNRNPLASPPTPSTGAVIADGAMTWVFTDESDLPNLDAPTTYTDTLWFDTFLLSRRLKLEFLKAKGFDTTAALQDYNHAFELVVNDDTQAPILSMSKRSFGALMGERNVPVTGFGS